MSVARWLIPCVLLALVRVGAAQTYYRVVAADGSVTYTDVPAGDAASVERVRTPGHDYSGRNEQGERRLREMREAAASIADERGAGSEADATRRARLATAERELYNARAALEQARQSKKSATPERIEMLEEAVELARRRLRAVQAGAE